ncbi:MAG TPA: tetratricopeptide repeat protein [Candidatus Omnitrophota bacterium]|nr:tetratricopeptide repeat protein [Candidatus Omnitrophota bacterium]HPD84207.1 tetratricopeptide repeat protein [Candidatus Omnitrophota bacterium]HRZ03063.1 tetratricopeptide repeat protein [Candidatus Omnitrophota bacterium]
MTTPIMGSSAKGILQVIKELRSSLKENRLLGVFLIILSAGIISYASGLLADFQFDDYYTIVNNPLIKHFSPSVLWDHYKARLVTNFSFTLNYLLFGLNVFWWHIVNLIIHVVAAFFAYLLTLITLQSPVLKDKFKDDDRHLIALFSSLIFLLHPVQTQAVTYIVQRATSLAGLFYLGTMYFYARARLNNHVRSYLWAVIFALLGSMTKPIVITLPFMIILYDFCFLSSLRKTKLEKFFLWALFLSPIITVPFLLVGKADFTWESIQTIQGYGTMPQIHYLLTQIKVVMTYVRLLFFPVGQNLDYDYRIAASFFEPAVFFSAIGLLALAWLALRLFKVNRLMSFGILWFFIALSAQSSIFPLLDVIYEHRLYLAVYGFSVFLCIALYKIIKFPKLYITVMGFIILALATTTCLRNMLWADSVAFMQDVVKKSPNKARPHNNLGFIYFTRGDFARAESEYKKAIALDPNYFVAYNNLGMAYYEQDKIDEAKEVFEKVIMMYPDYPDPYTGLGLVYQGLGREDFSFRLFTEAVTIYPYNAAGYIGLGNIYQSRGDLVTAKKQFEKAVWFNPDSAFAHYNLGNVSLRQGNFYEALLSYQRAVRIRPDFAQAFNNMGNIFFYFGDYEKAVDVYKKSIQYNPSLPETHLNLANALFEVGRIADSRYFASRAVELYRRQGRSNTADQIQEKLPSP